MADPRLGVDSKNEVFKNPVGFIPHHEQPSQDVINSFNHKPVFKIKGASALAARDAIANRLSGAIALGTAATFPTAPPLPSAKLPKAAPLLKSSNLAKANPYVLGASLLLHSEPLGADTVQTFSPGLRFRMPDDAKSSFEKKIKGQWQPTGISATPVFDQQYKIVAFEGLSQKDADLIGLPTTFPIKPPAVKPMGGFEAYQGDRSNRLENPAQKPGSITHTGHSHVDIPNLSITTTPITDIEQITILENRRYEPGVVTGKGQPVGPDWMREGIRNGGAPIPEQIADKLRGQKFDNFDQFREAFWTEVADDSELAKQFNSHNRSKIKKGLAPFPPISQHVGLRNRFELHHIEALGRGGDVYNIDNLTIMTPKAHIELHKND